MVGAQGATDMLSATKLDVPNATDRRQDERAPVGQPSTVRVAGGAPVEVVVEDLSLSGLLYRSTDRLAVGTAIQVGLAGSGAASAAVIRRDGDLHACLFDRPLPIDRLTAAFTNGTVVQGAFGANDLHLSPEPVIAKWPRQVRALVLLSAGAAPWLFFAALRWG